MCIPPHSFIPHPQTKLRVTSRNYVNIYKKKKPQNAARK